MAECDGIKESNKKIPRGWLLFYIGVIVWLVWYIFSYTPQISGWSQYKVFEEEMKKTQAKQVSIPTENPYEHNEKAIAEGKMIYMNNCAACHGEDLKGRVGPDLTGHLKYGETDDKKYETIAKGRGGGMPPFQQQLGRDRIWKVLAYVDSVREYGKRP
ncbi:MAG: cytochrome C [Nitrospirae bacterium]|nr:MAG: cytochrome C [Nitrospirota bacterium]